MGTTAQKLDYLNTTKEKIKDSINLKRAGITSSTTFRNYTALLKDALADVLKDTSTLWSNFPKINGEGTSLTLSNTYNSIISIDYKGNIN